MSDPKHAGRLSFLDGMRAIAALIVVVHHAQLEVWVDTASSSRYLGRLAVDVFIAISGFCLMLPVTRDALALRDGATRFFWRRARRILPPYYVATALSLALVWTCIGRKTGTTWDVAIPVTPRGVFAAVLMLNDVFHRGEINHAFWSIAVEWKIYFLFPALLLLARRIGVLGATALAVVGSLAVFALVHTTDLVGGTPHFVGLFALGTLGAAMARSTGGTLATLRDRTPWALVTGALAALVVLLVALGSTARLSSIEASLADTLVGAATASAMVGLSIAPESRIRRALSAPWLVTVGGFSYSLYLIHAPLLQVVWQYGVHPLHLGHAATFAMLVLAGLPFVLGCAYLFFLAFERPFTSAERRPAVSSPVAPA